MPNSEKLFRALPTDIDVPEFEELEIDSSPEHIAQLVTVLEDLTVPQTDREHALEELALIATEEVVEILRRYREHPAPDVEIHAAFAADMGAQLRSMRMRDEHPLLGLVLDLCEEIYDQCGPRLSRSRYKHLLARQCEAIGLSFQMDRCAVMKYHGQVVENTSLDFIIEDTLLVGVMSDWNEWVIYPGNGEEPIAPHQHFYAKLRASNLPVGVLVDFSRMVFDFQAMRNQDVDRGQGVVEYHIE